MRRSVAAAGTAVFFAVAPGVVAGLIPWWLTRWRLRGPLAAWAPVRIAGLIMLILGATAGPPAPKGPPAAAGPAAATAPSVLAVDRECRVGAPLERPRRGRARPLLRPSGLRG